MNGVSIVIILFFLGALLGGVYAHKDIATERKKLGSFYVGDEVFHCIKVTKFGEEE